MATDKNQHYVPQFYQRYFSVDGKNIGIYLLNEKKYIKQGPIKSQASESYFYAKEKAKESERNMASLEGKIKEALDRIIESHGENIELKVEEEEALLVSVALQLCRTKSTADLLNNLFDMMSKNILRGNKNVKISEEELSKVFIHLNYAPALSIAYTFEPIIRSMKDLQYKIVTVSENTSLKLLTSDNPVVIQNPFYERIGIDCIGLASKGLILYMPISPKCGVIYYDSNVYKVRHNKKKWIEIDDVVVRQLNKISIYNANNCVFFNSSTIPQHEIEKLVASLDRYRERAKLGNVPAIISNNSMVFGMYHRLPFCGEILKFMKELDKAKGIKSLDDLKRMKVSIYRNI